MFKNLNVFQISSQLASHSARQHSLTAKNIANADTPGYAAERLPDFADAFRTKAQMSLRTTRPEHMGGGAMAHEARVIRASSESSPNGNSVSIEQEMVDATLAKKDHNRAIAIYRHGLSIMRMSIGAK